jgi:hypothetical protein
MLGCARAPTLPPRRIHDPIRIRTTHLLAERCGRLVISALRLCSGRTPAIPGDSPGRLLHHGKAVVRAGLTQAVAARPERQRVTRPLRRSLPAQESALARHVARITVPLGTFAGALHRTVHRGSASAVSAGRGGPLLFVRSDTFPYTIVIGGPSRMAGLLSARTSLTGGRMRDDTGGSS